MKISARNVLKGKVSKVIGGVVNTKILPTKKQIILIIFLIICVGILSYFLLPGRSKSHITEPSVDPPKQVDPIQVIYKFDQKKTHVSKKEMGQVDTVKLKAVSNSDNVVKIIKKYDKIDPEDGKWFRVSMFDINNDGEKDILYTYLGYTGSCGYTWVILSMKEMGIM